MNIWNEIKSTFRQGSMITRLIYVNLAVFLAVRLVYVFFYLFKGQPTLIEWLALPSGFDLLLSRPWTLITYMFLHYDFIHILFNLLWLYWFGKIFLGYFDERKLLGLYFLGGLAGGILYIAGYNLFPAFSEIAPQGMLMGASASIIAIVIATAVYAPHFSVNLFLISSIFGPIKIVWIAIISVIIYVLGITGTNAGGNIAHLGGAVWGFIYMAQLKKGKDITSRFNNFLYSFHTLLKRKNRMHVSHRGSNTQRMTDWEYNKNKKDEKESINDILDKISKTGYENLSKSEKELLFKMGSSKGKPN